MYNNMIYQIQNEKTGRIIAGSNDYKEMFKRMRENKTENIKLLQGNKTLLSSTTIF